MIMSKSMQTTEPDRPILVSGLVNLETCLAVDGFPVAYQPVNYAFFRIDSRISGVGYNIALALKKLGASVRFLTLLGQDSAGDIARAGLREAGLNSEFQFDILKGSHVGHPV